MFTPQKNVWSGWSLSARKNGTGSDTGPNSNPSDGKGKSIVLAEPATPPLGINGMAINGDHLAEKIAELEKELFEYQYNMGLLLIEKKEWTPKYEELKQALAETKDALKREQAAHLIAMSDVEKREDELRKALGVEKQCVKDLEKVLREMRSEYAEIKFTADSKLAEANHLAASIDEKSLELEAKSHSADAKLAEISRKSSEIERKLQDVEAREAALRRERLSFITEKEAHDTTFSKQREDLQEWERKLREAEERLGDRQRILNQREERANEKDKIYKQKEKDIDELQKTLDEATSTVKRNEDDLASRLSKLAVKEKEHDARLKNLEMKEKELLVIEEELKAREKEEIQKLLDEHNRILEVKKLEFELECEQKRKLVDEELENKRLELHKKETDINHKEEKIVKREQALEKKSEKVKEKEQEFQSKLKDLKEREKLFKSEEKNLEAEKKQLLDEKEDLLTFKAGLEKVRADNEQLLLKIQNEKDQLEVTEEERAEYVRLQSELRQEREKCRQQKELLLKEAEDLKQQKEMFEKEWEELDDKRAEVDKGLKDISLEKEKFEKFKRSEEEKLQKEKLAAEDYVKREMEHLKLQKEAFSASMEHEKLVLSEQTQSERSQMQREFDSLKKELESNMQTKWEEMENDLHQKMKSFEEEKERESSNLSYLRDLARREMEELKQERVVMAREREEFAANKRCLEEEQIEIQKDIDQLMVLSEKLKEQREKFTKERERFISYVEKQSSCNNCGELTREFMLSDLQLSEIEALELPQSKFARVCEKEDSRKVDDACERQENDTSAHLVGSGTPGSGGTVSWLLQKCKKKIFNFSPGKKIEHHPVQNLTEAGAVPSDQINAEEANANDGNDVELSFAVVSGSVDVQRIQSGDSIRADEAGEDISVDEPSNVNSKAEEIAEDSHASDLKSGGHAIGKRGKGRVHRTRTMKAVIKDAKALLGEELDGQQQNGNAEESAHTNVESRGESSLNEQGRPRNGRKRNRDHTTVSQQDGDDEGQSDSVTLGQQRKRRQKATAAAQPPVQPRYNLRRPKANRGTAAALKVSPEMNEENGEAGRDGVGEIHYAKAPSLSVSVASENGGSRHLVRSVTEGHAQEATKERAETALSEEVNGTPERVREYRDGDEGEYEGPEEGDEEEYEHPGEASIGKKLWNFLTT